jgi:hypothetical protein
MMAHTQYRPRRVNSRRLDESSSIIVGAACYDIPSSLTAKGTLTMGEVRLSSTKRGNFEFLSLALAFPQQKFARQGQSIELPRIDVRRRLDHLRKADQPARRSALVGVTTLGTTQPRVNRREMISRLASRPAAELRGPSQARRHKGSMPFHASNARAAAITGGKARISIGASMLDSPILIFRLAET